VPRTDLRGGTKKPTFYFIQIMTLNASLFWEDYLCNFDINTIIMLLFFYMQFLAYALRTGYGNIAKPLIMIFNFRNARE